MRKKNRAFDSFLKIVKFYSYHPVLIGTEHNSDKIDAIGSSGQEY